MKSKLKILYLFSGTRTNNFQGQINVDYPDTPFYGMNHLRDLGYEAEFRDIYDLIKYQQIIRYIPFMWKHIFLTTFIKKYDIVFGPSLLYNVLFKRLFHIKTKFVLLNISLNRTLFVSKKKRFRYKLIKYLVNQLDAIICLSNYQQQDLINNYNVDQSKVHYVPLGVDENFWKPIAGIYNEIILSVGKDNGRDYQTLFTVAAKLPARQFVVVCAQRNIEGLTIPNNVKILLNRSIGEVREIYQSAKMLLLITHSDKHFEGSDCSGQTVLLDAMASALPIIASRKEYLNDYVEDGKNVLLTNFYDADDIVEKITRLDDENLRRSLGINARQTIDNLFTTKKMAEQLLTIFKEL